MILSVTTQEAETYEPLGLNVGFCVWNPIKLDSRAPPPGRAKHERNCGTASQLRTLVRAVPVQCLLCEDVL